MLLRHCCLLVLIACSLAGFAQTEAVFKKLKTFDENYEAAAKLFLDNENNGDAIEAYYVNADKLVNGYAESLEKNFQKKKDSVVYARGLLRLAWMRLMKFTNSDEKDLYANSEKAIKRALQLAPRSKLSNDLLVVYMRKVAVDLAQGSSAIKEDIGIISQIAGEKSFHYLDIAAAWERNKGNFLAAEKLALEAKASADPATSQVYQINRLLAGLYSILSEDKKAIEMGESNQKIVAAKGRRYSNEYYWAAFELAYLYTQSSLWEKAKQLYKQNLRDMSKDEAAISYYKEARVRFNTLYNLCWLYHDTGEESKGDSLFVIMKNVVDGFADKGDDLYADDCGVLSDYYFNYKKDYDSAIFFQKKVLAFGKKTGIREYEMQGNAEISSCYRKLKRYKDANILIDSAIMIAKEINCFNCVNHFLMRKARIFEKTGNQEFASSLIDQALDSVGERFGQSSDQYREFQYTEAIFNLRNKKFDKASPALIASVDYDINKINKTFSGLTEFEREATSLNHYEERFNDFNYFAVQAGKKDPTLISKMFDTRLFTKGILLNSASKWKQRIITSGDLRLINEFNQWQQNKELLTKLNALSQKNRKNQGINPDSLETATVELERKLQQRSEFFSRMSDRKRFYWTDIQKQLSPNEAAIEMIRIKKDDSDEKSDSVYYAALIVTAQTIDHPDMVVLANGAAIEKNFKYYQNSIDSRSVDTTSYRMFWKSIGNYLKSKKIQSLIFSGDGVYHQINLNALYNPITKKYLIDEINISLVTSTRDIVAINRKDEENNNYAILVGYPNYRLGASERKAIAAEKGDYLRSGNIQNMKWSGSVPILEGTKTEVNEIADILRAKNWQPEVLMGDQALEESIKTSFKPGVLHLATHGYFQEEKDTKKKNNPLLSSGLLLAGAELSLQNKNAGDVEDGILTAYEAMNLNLENTQLVVLSACETGRGALKNGEGVYGLQRAFMVAGARTIIMSMWKVSDDATSKLMAGFYGRWLGGQSKRDAFREAQLDLRKKYPEPYFWSAFVMVGRE